MKLEAIAFDLFGTILEIGTLRTVAAGEVGEENADVLVQRWRDRQVFYSFHCTMMGRYENFDRITEYALDYTLAQMRLDPDKDARARMAASWSTLAPYPDVKPALEALSGRGKRTAILTNGTPATATTALTRANVADLFDFIWSVEQVRAFKPSPQVYAIATAGFNLAPQQIGFVTSNGWDAIGAAAFGFNVIWCNRVNNPRETLGPPPAVIVSNLDHLATMID